MPCTAISRAESVHLERWPTSDEPGARWDPELVATMDAARDVCSAASSPPPPPPDPQAKGLPNRQTRPA